MTMKEAMSPAARAFIKVSERVPLLRGVGKRVYASQFYSRTGHIRLFRGIYRNFAEAARAAPPSAPQSCDNEASAQLLADDRLRICAFDYPVMFWLSRLLPGCRRVLDWGGGVGITYFGYRRYLNYAPDLSWLVCDVPAVVSLGSKIAAQEGAPGLRFTSSLAELQQADILLAAGSLHFIEDPFGPLQAASVLPRHVLLNKVPAYDLPSAVTLHNMGTAFCPYHLFNRTEFVGRFERLGYRLIDEWRSPDLSCPIPFHRGHSIQAYSGFYLVRPGASG
ncbi:MAG TPA: methyltransferase, TIGR04325 family [Steroidobacteraceae bacterium]|nr:methyltransferase, TIGR04325 family [Steroidobacteraceae bacterium]